MNREFRQVARLLVAGLVVLFIAVGCGGSDSSSKDTEQTQDGLTQDSGSSDAGVDVPEQGDVEQPQDTVQIQGTRLTILHINDFHSHLVGFSPEGDYSPETAGDDDTRGGAARIAAIVKQVRSEVGEDNVVVVDAGDFSQGTLFATIARSAGAELHVMSKMGVQVGTLGNHEFDWGPDGVVSIVEAGVEETGIKLVASNIVTSADSPEDDGFDALYEKGLLHKDLVFEMGNGLKVGFFGLLGDAAKDDAPFMVPMETRNTAEVAAEEVESLRSQGADVVVALSHSGVSEGEMDFEDEAIAKSVAGLDVIISGHTHTVLTTPYGDADTFVVQTGNYGKNVGRLDLVLNEGKLELLSYSLIPVDDSLAGDMEVQALVETFIQEIDELIQGYGLSYHQALAHTDFDIMTVEIKETALGNLISDALLAKTNEVLLANGEGPVQVVVEANGTIRDSLMKGKSGVIQLADVFRVIPLGSGPDGMPGYPMVKFFVTPREMKFACELPLAVPFLAEMLGGKPEDGDTFFLQYAGMRCEYDPNGTQLPPDQVRAIYLLEGDSYSTESIDMTDNETLIAVGVNYYIASLIGQVKGMSMGMLDITPKNAEGNEITDFNPYIIDSDPQTEGVQELKPWVLMSEYLKELPDLDGDDLADIPERYKTPEGRLNAID